MTYNAYKVKRVISDISIYIYIYFYIFFSIFCLVFLNRFTFTYLHTYIYTHFEGLILRLSSSAAMSSYYKKCWLSMTNKNNASSSQEPKHQILHVISSYRTWFKGSIIHKKKKNIYPLLRRYNYTERQGLFQQTLFQRTSEHYLTSVGGHFYLCEITKNVKTKTKQQQRAFLTSNHLVSEDVAVLLVLRNRAPGYQDATGAHGLRRHIFRSPRWHYTNRQRQITLPYRTVP